MIERLIKNSVEKENAALHGWIENKREKFPIDEAITIKRDIVYSQDNEECRLDVFRLNNANGELPTIINLHGGGLVYGYKEQNDWICAEFAKRGYVVFSVEYPKIPTVRIYELWELVATALNYIADNMEEFGADRNNVFWTGDSAGAYIITNLCAMKYNSKLREAARVREISLNCSALGLMSGMFYVTKRDKIGLTMPKVIFGDDYKKQDFYEYINPENKEFVDSLKPCFMATSQEDMLKHHTMSFYNYLKENRKNCKLVKFGKNPKLEHAFVALYPEYRESQLIIDKMDMFFEKFM